MYLNRAGKKVKTAIVIPAYKVSKHIIEVIQNVPKEIDELVVVVDACPEGTFEILKGYAFGRRIHIIEHAENTGVGGAMKTGYRKALDLGAEIIVKVDGDGQMDTQLIPKLIEPILSGNADYTKGNRFHSLQYVKKMPKVRLVGNLALSFLSKLSTGYYQLFDPNNGFTAASAKIVQAIDLKEVDDRFFFETDMLFNLNLLRANVHDVPMPSIYQNEVSNLKITQSVPYFFTRHVRNTLRRLTINYFLRDFSLASIQLLLGLILAHWGAILGLVTWFKSQNSGIPSQPGTIVLVAILCLSGLQLLLSFIQFDMSLTRRNQG